MPDEVGAPQRPGIKIVAMIDVLGARVSNVGAAQMLLTKIQDIYQRSKSSVVSSAERSGPAWFHDITIVGDTIIIIWDAQYRGWLQAVGTVCGSFVVLGLSEGIAFRGAVGIGELVMADDAPIILGPGISGAADWDDELDAIGVVATPKFAMLLENDAFGQDGSTAGSFFVKAPTPLKSGRAADMWVASWPDVLALWARTGGAECREQLLTWLQHFEMPRAVHQKYLNTLSFFDWYHGRYSEHMTTLAALAQDMESERR